MSDVFLSYSREDQSVARQFAEGFEREGLGVWWDATLRSGEAYDQVTEKALRAAKAVVVLWSKRSVESRWVRAEATLGDRNRTLVPAMIEPCERPIMFELTQTADLSHWNGAAADKAWLAFLTDVRKFVGTPAQELANPAVLRDADVAPPVSARRGSRDDRPSLAILPFTNRSGDRADDVFADGMVEDLILALSLSSGIKVIAQSATNVYRKNVSDLRTIGQELGVRYLLEGNVRRVGEALRVVAQLVEANDGAILWSQRFDRPLIELAALQEQLVIEVAGQLGDQVERAEIERALGKPGDLTAWEAVMRACSAVSTYSPESLRTGAAEARKALAIAPDYALGHAVLAAALGGFFARGGGSDAALRKQAQQHAERALALGANDPLVAGWAGNALCNCGAWKDAQRVLERVLEQHPNQPIARMALAMVFVRQKRPDDVFRQIDAMQSLAPRGNMSHNGIAFRGLAHYMAGRLEPARLEMERACALNPTFVYPLKDIAVICAKMGLEEEAREAVRRLRSVAPAVTLEELEAFNVSSVIPPDVGAEMNTVFRKVWLGTPMEAESPETG